MNEVDLHIHSEYDYGDKTARQIVSEAIRKGLKAIAITDHSKIDGAEEALKAKEEGKEKTVEIRERYQYETFLSLKDNLYKELFELAQEVIEKIPYSKWRGGKYLKKSDKKGTSAPSIW